MKRRWNFKYTQQSHQNWTTWRVVSSVRLRSNFFAYPYLLYFMAFLWFQKRLCMRSVESRTDEERCILLDRRESLKKNVAQIITFKRAQDFFTLPKKERKRNCNRLYKKFSLATKNLIKVCREAINFHSRRRIHQFYIRVDVMLSSLVLIDWANIVCGFK